MSRTEALQRALEAVYSGRQATEAECVLDQLRDAGFDVVWRPGLQVESFPAVTSGDAG